MSSVASLRLSIYGTMTSLQFSTKQSRLAVAGLSKMETSSMHAKYEDTDSGKLPQLTPTTLCHTTVKTVRKMQLETKGRRNTRFTKNSKMLAKYTTAEWNHRDSVGSGSIYPIPWYTNEKVEQILQAKVLELFPSLDHPSITQYRLAGDSHEPTLPFSSSRQGCDGMAQVFKILDLQN